MESLKTLAENNGLTLEACQVAMAALDSLDEKDLKDVEPEKLEMLELWRELQSEEESELDLTQGIFSSIFREHICLQDYNYPDEFVREDFDHF